MGFGVCNCCGGYWCSVGAFVSYCVCKHGNMPQELAYARGWQRWYQDFGRHRRPQP